MVLIIKSNDEQIIKLAIIDGLYSQLITIKAEFMGCLIVKSNGFPSIWPLPST